jgi:hypothetical protein
MVVYFGAGIGELSIRPHVEKQYSHALDFRETLEIGADVVVEWGCDILSPIYRGASGDQTHET